MNIKILKSKMKSLISIYYDKIYPCRSDKDKHAVENLQPIDKSKPFQDFLLKDSIWKEIQNIQFKITLKCNYKCEYCYQHYKDRKHVGDDVFDAFLSVLPQMHSGSKVRLIGGEPTLHPRIFEIAESCSRLGYTLAMPTNFSMPNSFFKKMIDRFDKKKQLSLHVSIHLTQIESVDSMIKKISDLKEYGKNILSIRSSCVLTEDNFEACKELKEKMDKACHRFILNRLYDDDHTLHTYPQYIEEYLTEKNVFAKKSHVMRSKLKSSSYGFICSAGQQYVKVNQYGDIFRCPESEKVKLGNLLQEPRTLAMPLPCVSEKCNCLISWNDGYMDFDTRDVAWARHLEQFTNEMS